MERKWDGDKCTLFYIDIQFNPAGCVLPTHFFLPPIATLHWGLFILNPTDLTDCLVTITTLTVPERFFFLCIKFGDAKKLQTTNDKHVIKFHLKKCRSQENPFKVHQLHL